MAKSGLIAVASLDGGPPDRDDAVALGLHGANDAQHLDGAILRTVDGEIAAAEGYARAGPRTLAFLGEARETEALAAQLDMPGADAAALAMRVVDEWDSGRANALRGEWSLMQWDEERRELVIAASPARRDLVFVGQAGGKVAIAPSLGALADLPWIGAALDDVGLARGLARRELRNADPHATMLAAVTRLPPGEMLRIDAGGQRRVEPVAEAPPEPWRGSFDEAVAALDAALRAEIRAAIAPHRRIAVMLSGGLDSSLLAAVVAEERRADQDVVLLCSVASDAGRHADERDYAALVAKQTGLPLELVVAPPDADLFEPEWATMADGGPNLRWSHHVNAALQHAAEAYGATLLLDGIGGEDHVSREVTFRSWRPDPRAWVNALRRWRTRADPTGQANFHVRLSPDFLARLPDEFRRPIRWSGVPAVPRDALIGPPIAFSTPYSPTTVAENDLRYAMPYRARSLQRLAAGMPAAFTERDGMTRALARAMLRGRVPEAVRLRPTSILSPAPEHFAQLQRQAPGLGPRIARFRDEGIGATVDLDWLDAVATQVATTGAKSWHQAHALQLTAILAAFLSGWQRRS